NVLIPCRLVTTTSANCAAVNRDGLPLFTVVYRVTQYDLRLESAGERKEIHHLYRHVVSFLVEIPKCKISLTDTLNVRNVCRRKIGIMQTARKRSADSRITLATVARAGCVSTGRGRENGVYFSANLTGTRPYFIGCPKVAYSVDPGNIEIARGWKFGLVLENGAA
ncbi:hypothetical protein ALC60_06120, partial [Trachymyrmex zeteki]